jgi:hypothetical protein
MPITCISAAFYITFERLVLSLAVPLIPSTVNRFSHSHGKQDTINYGFRRGVNILGRYRFP